MPCSDGYGPRMGGVDPNYDYERSEKRRHKLAAELCTARKVLIDLYKKSGTTSPALRKRIEHEIAEQRKHRAHDKATAISRATDEVTLAKRDIASVRQLGGIPGLAQKKRLKEARVALAMIKLSDPMDTDLY